MGMVRMFCCSITTIALTVFGTPTALNLQSRDQFQGTVGGYSETYWIDIREAFVADSANAKTLRHIPSIVVKVRIH